MYQIIYVHTLDFQKALTGIISSTSMFNFSLRGHVSQKLYKLFPVETLEKMLVDEFPLPILMSMKSIICPGCEIL